MGGKPTKGTRADRRLKENKNRSGATKGPVRRMPGKSNAST